VLNPYFNKYRQTGSPKAMGIIKVNRPNRILLFLFFLNSPRSNSKPAINMIYRRPIVENKSTAEFLFIRNKPCGPMIVPEMIKPIIPGILNLLKIKGTRRMINNISEKIITELVKGVWNACNIFSKILFIAY
jgi:hypothetical protein